MSLLSSREACDVTDAFLYTLYGDGTFIRWKELKHKMKFHTESDYVNWLLDIASHYEQEGIVATTDETYELTDRETEIKTEHSTYETKQNQQWSHSSSDTEPANKKIKSEQLAIHDSINHQVDDIIDEEIEFLVEGSRGGARGEEYMTTTDIIETEERADEFTEHSTELQLQPDNDNNYDSELEVIPLTSDYDMHDIKESTSSDLCEEQLSMVDDDQVSPTRAAARQTQHKRTSGCTNRKESASGSTNRKESVSGSTNRKESVSGSTNRKESASGSTNRSIRKKFPCEHCYYSTNIRGDLRKHHTSVHARLRAYSCEHCHYTSTRPDHLRSHMVQRHQYPTNYVCNVCGKPFTSPSALEGHLRRCVRQQ